MIAKPKIYQFTTVGIIVGLVFLVVLLIGTPFNLQQPAPRLGDCDALLSGTRTFPELQNLMSSGDDINGDGKRVVCVRGVVINDEGAGDEKLTIRPSYTGEMVLRGLPAGDSPSRIRKVTTTSSEYSHDLLAQFSNMDLTIENLSFELSSSVNQTTALLLDGGRVDVRNIAIDIDAAERSTGILHDTDGTIEGLSIDMRDAWGEGVGFRRNISLVDQVVIQGSGGVLPFSFSDGVRVARISDVDATGLSQGLSLDGWGVIIDSVTTSSFDAAGIALSLSDHSRISHIEDLSLRGCGMVMGEQTSIGTTSYLSISPPEAAGCN
jgi:hypothetical protein